MQVAQLQRVSPLTTLARQGSSARPPARPEDRLTPRALTADASPTLHPTFSRAFEAERASLLTSGSRDLGIDRSSGQYADEEARDVGQEYTERGRGRLSALTQDTCSSRSQGTDETGEPFALEAYMMGERGVSGVSSSGGSSDDHSRGEFDTTSRVERPSTRQDPVVLASGEKSTAGGSALASDGQSKAFRTSPMIARTHRATESSPILSRSLSDSLGAVATPMKVTVPSPAGRLRSHTPSGSYRNFSRPSTQADVSPDSSPQRPTGSTSRIPEGPPTVSSTIVSADISPIQYRERPLPDHVHSGGKTGLGARRTVSSPDALPQGWAPALSRGASAASSVDPMTPASTFRGLPDTFQREMRSPTMSKREVGKGDETRSNRANETSPKWKFWSRKASRPAGEDCPILGSTFAPIVQVGLPSPSLEGLEEELRKVRHRRDLSDLRDFRGPQMDGTSSPPSRRPDLPPLANTQGDDETEMLRDHGDVVRGALVLERVPSQMSSYSHQSMRSTASSQCDISYMSPTQSSSHGHAAVGSETAASPGTGPSMQKVKFILRAPLPTVEPRTKPGLPSEEEASTLSPNDPDDCLLLGIDYHERGELERSAMFFERAAKVNGGCGMGKLLWGLTLRHGWGCAVDQAKGFAYLQKAAETVVDNLDGFVAEGGRAGTDKSQKAARAELVLSIYELGMSFRKGWGVKKDKAMALDYFELASTLGDPDAQQELGFAYLHGKGCKKDKAKSAHYYRLAADQGIQSFGQQWIWRTKYGGPGAS